MSPFGGIQMLHSRRQRWTLIAPVDPKRLLQNVWLQGAAVARQRFQLEFNVGRPQILEETAGGMTSHDSPGPPRTPGYPLGSGGV